jgi:hypothetical protein
MGAMGGGGVALRVGQRLLADDGGYRPGCRWSGLEGAAGGAGLPPAVVITHVDRMAERGRDVLRGDGSR